VVQAATLKYREREEAIRQEARAQLQKLGLTREQAKGKYPTPQVALVSSGCLPAGGTGEVAVKGKFTPGTKFVFQSDALEVVKETLTPTEYRATVKVMPNIAPHTAPVVAISPVSGITTHSHPGVAIGGRTEWIMDAANGWRIIARSPANKACGGTNNRDEYDVEFFRKAETSPFEKRTATGHYEDSSSTEYFTISQTGGAEVDQQQRFMQLMQKMSDPKLSDVERQKVMAEIEKAQHEMTANMQKVSSMEGAMKAAKEAEAKRKAFGCERIEVKLQGTNLTGTMRCSEAIGTRIALTGAMKVLGR
jgi:hypothetical protein